MLTRPLLLTNQLSHRPPSFCNLWPSAQAYHSSGTSHPFSYRLLSQEEQKRVFCACHPSCHLCRCPCPFLSPSGRLSDPFHQACPLSPGPFLCPRTFGGCALRRPALLHLPPLVTTGCASDKYLIAITKSSAKMPHSRRLCPCRAERNHSDHWSAALSVIVDASTISFGRCSGSGYAGSFGWNGVGANISSGRSNLFKPYTLDEPPGKYLEEAP